MPVILEGRKQGSLAFATLVTVPVCVTVLTYHLRSAAAAAAALATACAGSVVTVQ